MAVLGIDPGKSGAACLLTSDDEIFFYDWPYSDDPADVFSAMREWWADYHIEIAALELVKASSYFFGSEFRGVKSQFSLGMNCGHWHMLLIGLDIPYIRPMPKEWQEFVGIKKKKGEKLDTKERAKQMALQLYPHVKLYGPKGGYKDGRADALLLAHYARKNK